MKMLGGVRWYKRVLGVGVHPYMSDLNGSPSFLANPSETGVAVGGHEPRAPTEWLPFVVLKLMDMACTNKKDRTRIIYIKVFGIFCARPISSETTGNGGKRNYQVRSLSKQTVQYLLSLLSGLAAVATVYPESGRRTLLLHRGRALVITRRLVPFHQGAPM
jgi:hypothetical protein